MDQCGPRQGQEGRSSLEASCWPRERALTPHWRTSQTLKHAVGLSSTCVMSSKARVPSALFATAPHSPQPLGQAASHHALALCPAAQFNGNEKRQSSPSPSRDRRRQLRAPGGGFKPIKHGSPEFCGILGERVDPTVPLEKQM